MFTESSLFNKYVKSKNDPRVTCMENKKLGRSHEDDLRVIDEGEAVTM
jgi:hypothetical protein